MGKKQIEIIEENYVGDTKIFFKKASEIKNGFKPRSTIIRSDYESLITDKIEVAREFRNMFDRMLNLPTQNEHCKKITTIEKYLENPTVDEVEIAINMLKNEKTPGEDGIAAELLKKGGKVLIIKVKQLIEKIWKDEVIPLTWNMSLLCPIHKKGDIIDCQNYRGISLLNTSYKVLSNVILNRIKPYANEIIEDYQAGFTQGK